MYISHLLTVTNPNIVYNNIPNKENKNVNKTCLKVEAVCLCVSEVFSLPFSEQNSSFCLHFG